MPKLRLSWQVVAAGGVFGLLFAVLIKLGNPPNMGACVACFTRDIAGALGLHGVQKLSYLRPEIPGFILGAFIASLAAKQFRPSGGASAILCFVISAFVAIGALVFLGCPVRAMGRLAGGDPTAIAGVVGLVAGAWVGVKLLERGFSLGRSRKAGRTEGYIVPALTLGLLVLAFATPPFVKVGSAARAPALASLGAALLIGVLGDRSKLCFVGAMRDLIFFRMLHLFQGIVAFLVVCFAANLLLGQFHPGAHPVAHTNHVAGFLGMVIVGLGSTLLGGCPFRQMILAGSGSVDAAVCVLGLTAGTAVAHNFGLAASPSGVPQAGLVATVAGLVVLLAIGLLNRE
jgi:YedE family putative selenium metabolism protein